MQDVSISWGRGMPSKPDQPGVIIPSKCGKCGSTQFYYEFDYGHEWHCLPCGWIEVQPGNVPLSYIHERLPVNRGATTLR